jgi:hypothetical protein
LICKRKSSKICSNLVSGFARNDNFSLEISQVKPKSFFWALAVHSLEAVSEAQKKSPYILTELGPLTRFQLAEHEVGLLV